MRSVLRYAVLGGAVLAISACGKKGNLVYPDLLVPAAPVVSQAIQSGTVVKLQYILPDSDRAGNRISNLAGMVINRRVNDADAGQACRSCMTDYQLFRRLYLDALPDGVERQGERLVLLDAEVTPGKQYSYVAVPFTSDGTNGADSLQTTVQVVPAVLPPILRVESYPTEIRLNFVSLTPVEGVLVGYNLYRTDLKRPFPYQPLNRQPLAAPEYVDTGLARETVYRYQARSVVRLPSGTLVEGLVSNVVEGRLKDDE